MSLDRYIYHLWTHLHTFYHQDGLMSPDRYIYHLSTHLLWTIGMGECPLTVNFTIFELTYILSTIRKGDFPLSVIPTFLIPFPFVCYSWGWAQLVNNIIAIRNIVRLNINKSNNHQRNETDFLSYVLGGMRISKTKNPMSNGAFC